MTNIVPKFESCKISFLPGKAALAPEIDSFVTEWNSDSPVFKAKTSGSTGIPKQVELHKKYAWQSVLASNSFFHFDAMQTMGLCLSPETIGGKMQILRSAGFGLELLVLGNERNPLKNLDRTLDFVTLVPLQVETILEETPDQLNWCKNVLVGGAKVTQKLREKLQPFDTRFFESYGMTETYSHVAVKTLGALPSPFEALNGIRFSQQDGQLVIHAPQIGLEALLTNDVVDLLDERHFNLLGRSDFAINSGGYKFHPELLEQKLEGRIPVDYFIIGEADPVFGESVTLYLEAHYNPETEYRVQHMLDEYFERYEKPKKIYFLPDFVRTNSGKVNRLATQKTALEP